MKGSLAQRFRNLLDSLRTEGPILLSYRLVLRILAPVLSCDVIYFFEFHRQQPLPSAASSCGLSIRVRGLGADAAALVRELSDASLVDAATVSDRLDRGDVMFAAYAGDALAGYLWITFRAIWATEVEATLLVEPDEGVAYDGFVLPAWRGHGTLWRLESAALRYAFDRGCRRVLFYLTWANRPSLKTQQRLQMKKVMTVLIVRAVWRSHPYRKLFPTDLAPRLEGVAR